LIPDFPTSCKEFARQIGGRSHAVAALGVAAGTFKQWCDGRSTPTSERLVRLAMERVLEVNFLQPNPNEKYNF
jgi:DNA-binding transcriptional regulator YdaS (Cro superfamily)